MALTEKTHASGFLLSEASGNRSRDKGTLASGQNLGAGTVLGKIKLGSAAVSGAGNTGTGTLTLDATTPKLAGAEPGNYVATCILVATAGAVGTFRVENPEGVVLGDVLGTAIFADDIKFVIAPGTADFVLGDKFTINIATAAGYFTLLGLTALDGSQHAAAILVADCNASTAAAPCAVIARDAEVITTELTWPAAASAAEKALATDELAALGIILR